MATAINFAGRDRFFNVYRLIPSTAGALAMSWIPSLATAATGGVSITLGLTDICTARKTSRPARSIAVAILKSRSMLAFEAETSEGLPVRYVHLPGSVRFEAVAAYFIAQSYFCELR